MRKIISFITYNEKKIILFLFYKMSDNDTEP